MEGFKTPVSLILQDNCGVGSLGLAIYESVVLCSVEKLSYEDTYLNFLKYLSMKRGLGMDDKFGLYLLAVFLVLALKTMVTLSGVL